MSTVRIWGLNAGPWPIALGGSQGNVVSCALGCTLNIWGHMVLGTGLHGPLLLGLQTLFLHLQKGGRGAMS